MVTYVNGYGKGDTTTIRYIIKWNLFFISDLKLGIKIPTNYFLNLHIIIKKKVYMLNYNILIYKNLKKA